MMEDAQSNRPTVWPYVRLALPTGTGDEDAASLTQAAVEAGALGSAVEKGELHIYLSPTLDATAATELRRAVEAEAARLGCLPSPRRSNYCPTPPGPQPGKPTSARYRSAGAC
jgi:hypothetical protein